MTRKRKMMMKMNMKMRKKMRRKRMRKRMRMGTKMMTTTIRNMRKKPCIFLRDTKDPCQQVSPWHSAAKFTRELC